ncbi:sugar phosphate isomerase/epimerase family protein [Halohasta litorea]|uniref:Sugar phosphate isomerase/epimerase family protein n=1 Tax=Halohasta litorea TaxID=869891 RepID=A0ABD6DFH8_9EURY|nr:sugar phosphate isomerase/epimerase family protein [Halohasta litorea]
MSRLGAAMDVRFNTPVETFLETLTDLGLNHLELKQEYLEGYPETPTPSELGELTDQYNVSLTYHAPFRDWNMGSFNDDVREASVDLVKRTLDDASNAGAGAVVLHGGSVPYRYPDWVQTKAAANARQSLIECATYAEAVEVPICVENQPTSESKRRHTTTPTDLADFLADVPVDKEFLKVTLDVGHAKVSGHEWEDFVSAFGDRIGVCHLHTNDGTGDQHEPLEAYKEVVETVPADYFVFEMLSVDDVVRCVEGVNLSV